MRATPRGSNLNHMTGRRLTSTERSYVGLFDASQSPQKSSKSGKVAGSWMPRAFPAVDVPSKKDAEACKGALEGLEGAQKLAGSYFFFECEVGQGNFLDFIRAGLAPHAHDRGPGNKATSRART